MNAHTSEPAGLGHNLRDPLEAEIEEALKEFGARYDERGGEVERCKVGNEDEAERATALAGILADVLEDAEKKRVEIKEPYLKGSRMIDRLFGGFAVKVANAKASIVAKIESWRDNQEAERKAEADRLEREAVARLAAAEEAAETGSLLEAARLEREAEAAARASARIVVPAAPIRSVYGQTASTRKEWKYEVLDHSKLPSTITQHPKVREAMGVVIGMLIRSGVRDIEGVRIYAENKTTIRR